MRGEIVRLAAPRGGRGQDQQGCRFAVILQRVDDAIRVVLEL